MDDGRDDDAHGAPGAAALATTVPGHRASPAPPAPDPERTWDLPEDDRRAAAQSELGPGARLGRFVVRRRLGAGGMGVVFAADDPDLGRAVALKLVRDDAAPGLRTRLLREAQAMARLQHPNVVRVFEVGTADGRLYIAMELVDGETLTHWLAAAPRTWREVVAKLVEIGAGLSAVHAAGLVHRDFKPDNVLVDRGGHARVADFGLARLDEAADPAASPALAQPLTRTGAMMGTPGYMAPEQQWGSDVDARADQYSFCVAAREALGAQLAAAPRSIRAAIARGLSYDASERFASVGELCAVLARAIAPRRGRWIAAGVAMLAATGAVAIGVAATRGGVVTREVVVHDRADPVRVAVLDAGATIAGALDAGQPVVAHVAAARDAGATRVAIAPTPPRPGSLAGRGSGSGSGPGSGSPGASGQQELQVPSSPAIAGGASAPHVQAPLIPPTKPMPAADLPAVRAALHDYGYRAFPLKDLDDDIPGSIANGIAARQKYLDDAKPGDARPAIVSVLIGMMRRRGGDCAGAGKDIRPALKTIEAVPQFAMDQKLLQSLGRGYLTLGLCAFTAGDAAGAVKALDTGTMYLEWSSSIAPTPAEAAEARIAWGMAIVEAGGNRWKVIVYRGGRAADEPAQKAMLGWLAARGLTWDDVANYFDDY